MINMLKKSILALFAFIFFSLSSIFALEFSNGDYIFDLNPSTNEAIIKRIFLPNNGEKRSLVIPPYIDVCSNRYYIRYISEEAVKPVAGHCDVVLFPKDTLKDTESNRSAINWFSIYDVPLFKNISSSAELF